ALLLIDMQKLALAEELVAKAVERGVDEALARSLCAEYEARCEAVNANCARLLEAFRSRDMTPIHVRIQAYAGDGRDTGPSHRRVGYIIPPGDYWGEWIEEATPLPGEIVLPKTCSGAVIGTNLDKVLRNLGVHYVVALGYYTDQCVETTVRDLHDLGYDVTLATDCTATPTRERYEASMLTCGGVYCRKATTDEILAQLAGIETV
ncbi:MAG: cysteine hydrolase, partial [Oscillospiraceae bacterium]|nr:cysteine hydrolase [Oscillospiraceae bacterium]